MTQEINHKPEIHNKESLSTKTAANLASQFHKQIINELKTSGQTNSKELAQIKSDVKVGINLEPEATMTTIATKTNDNQFSQVISEIQKLGAASSVQQNVNYGDCWFESSLSSLATSPQGQKLIANMITLNKDGSFKVQFPAYPDLKINVTKHDIQKDNLKNTGLWANILEAAIIKELPQQSREGLTPIVALKLLTNKDVEQMKINPETNVQNLESILNKHLSENLPMVASSDKSTNSKLVGPNGPIFNDHAYSVVGYNNTDKTIEIRDPFALNHNLPVENKNIPQIGQTIDGITNMGDGVLKMDVATFTKIFTELDITHDRPLKINSK